jgi:xanthine/CO dehydrogenase XdhC/CoxF family maturation factor
MHAPAAPAASLEQRAALAEALGFRPGFPAGLRVLVVGEQPLAPAVETVLRSVSYEVTQCAAQRESLTEAARTAEVVLIQARFSPPGPRIAGFHSRLQSRPLRLSHARSAGCRLLRAL